MTVYTAERVGRILVWPTHTIAYAADAAQSAESKHSKGMGRLTVWPTSDEAHDNITFDDAGDGAPEWVPENAVIHIDFVNDRAWTEADGEVEIDTLVGADPNSVNSWSDTAYSSDELTSDGLVCATLPPALIGAALTKIMADATVTVQMKTVVEIDTNDPFVFASADGSDAVVLSWPGNSSTSAYSYGGSLSASHSGVNTATGAINKIAFTITTVRIDFAVNGTEATSASLDSSDRPPGNPLEVVVVAPHLVKTALQTITIYDPLPDTDGLSELSEV